jgi:predicted FMN-binding regulatory protein PaiB
VCLPRAFVETDLAQLDRLPQADPFITLVSTDGDILIDTPMRARDTQTGD